MSPANAAPIAQAANAVGRTAPTIRESDAPRSSTWSAISTAPMGGTKTLRITSQLRKWLQTPASATPTPTIPSSSVSTRIRPPTMWLQLTAPLYRQCEQTEPRLTNTNTIASALSSGPAPSASNGRKLPPFAAGAATAPAATTTPPVSWATMLATGNAVNAASTPSRPLRDQRVKSAVIVPESANVAMISDTAAPKLSEPPAMPPTPPYENTAPRSWSRATSTR